MLLEVNRVAQSSVGGRRSGNETGVNGICSGEPERLVTAIHLGVEEHSVTPPPPGRSHSQQHGEPTPAQQKEQDTASGPAQPPLTLTPSIATQTQCMPRPIPKRLVLPLLQRIVRSPASTFGLCKRSPDFGKGDSLGSMPGLVRRAVSAWMSPSCGCRGGDGMFVWTGERGSMLLPCK